jgi:hypothetical protein
MIKEKRMVNKKGWIVGLFVLLVFGFIVLACGKERDIKYSIQVNNKAAGRAAITDTDTVELYIHYFEYNHDTFSHEGYGVKLMIIADGDRDIGDDKILNNAGWFSVEELELPLFGGFQNGPYSSFDVRISKIRVNGVEYNFPNEGVSSSGRKEVTFGNPTSLWNGGIADYPDNFSGIYLTDSVVSLKTVLTVEPDILVNDGGTLRLADDPYKFIKVEGRINE